MIPPKLCRRLSARTGRLGKQPANSSRTLSSAKEMPKNTRGNGEAGGRDRGGFKSSRHGKASAAGPKAQQKLAAEDREKRGAEHTAHERRPLLKGQRIDPRRINGKETVADISEGTSLA